MLFSFDKVTTGKDIFVFFIWNSNPVAATIAGLLSSASLVAIWAKTQFLDQFKINSTSQLINDIFRDLQKILKYFSGMTISVSF